MTSTNLEITRRDDFPWGRTTLRMKRFYENESYIQFEGLAEVTAPGHERYVRVEQVSAAHTSIIYLLEGPLAPDQAPAPESRILGASLRAAKSHVVTTVRAEAGTTLTVSFETNHVIFLADYGTSTREVCRAELADVSVLKLETVTRTALAAAVNLVTIYSATPLKAITPDDAPLLALPLPSDGRLDWLRSRKNALLEILAGLCGPVDRHTDRNRRGYCHRRSRG